jgi:hypothetical protein
MNRKSEIRDALGSIETNKPRPIPKRAHVINQTFAPPAPMEDWKELSTSEEGQPKPEDKSQVEMPPGKQPGGDEPEGNVPEGEMPGVDLPGGIQTEYISDARKKKRREKMVRSALQENRSLSDTTQDKLLQIHLADGWGKLAHGVTRQLKSPSRYGLKLVDVALIMTVYDRTIASVNAAMFAPISADDFRNETKMDEANIRCALKGLHEKTVLLKIKTGAINFWALNPHYFSLKEKGSLPPGKLPGGKLPARNAPGVKQGNLPGAEGGQTTRGQTSQTSGIHEGISTAKNLLKESKKESSLSSSDYPDDMRARWSRFQNAGYENKIKPEREIFEELFVRYGNEFFENCGRVVTYLEEKGTGKEGAAGRIHSPMIWIKDHWESNLASYRERKSKDAALEEAHAKKLELEAKTKVAQLETERTVEEELHADDAWNGKMDEAAERLLSILPGEGEFNAFVEEAVELSGYAHTRGLWKKSGWRQPLVRICVLEHFLKVEAGAMVSRVSLAAQQAIA